MPLGKFLNGGRGRLRPGDPSFSHGPGGPREAGRRPGTQPRAAPARGRTGAEENGRRCRYTGQGLNTSTLRTMARTGSPPAGWQMAPAVLPAAGFDGRCRDRQGRVGARRPDRPFAAAMPVAAAHNIAHRRAHHPARQAAGPTLYFGPAPARACTGMRPGRDVRTDGYGQAMSAPARPASGMLPGDWKANHTHRRRTAKE